MLPKGQRLSKIDFFYEYFLLPQFISELFVHVDDINKREILHQLQEWAESHVSYRIFANNEYNNVGARHEVWHRALQIGFDSISHNLGICFHSHMNLEDGMAEYNRFKQDQHT